MNKRRSLDKKVRRLWKRRLFDAGTWMKVGAPLTPIGYTMPIATTNVWFGCKRLGTADFITCIDPKLDLTSQAIRLWTEHAARFGHKVKLVPKEGRTDLFRFEAIP